MSDNGTVLAGGCTGTIVDEYHVLTAAHCLYAARFDEWATNVTVASMVDNQSGRTVEPYSIAEARIARAYEGYVDLGWGHHDVAMLTLDRSIGDPGATRVMDWGAYPVNDSVYNHGYPTSPPDATAGYPSLWEDTGPGLGYKTGFRNGSFAVDVDADDGHSGGPFYHHDTDTGSYELLGILSVGISTMWGPRVTFGKGGDFDNWTSSTRYVDPPDNRPEFVFEGANFTAEKRSLSVSPSENVVPGVTPVTFEHAIRNVGTADGPDEVPVSVRVAGSDGCDRSDQVVTTWLVSAPDAFDATPVALTTTIPEDAPLGETELCLTIDAGVAEFDDQPPVANRTETRTLTVVPTSAHRVGDAEVSIVDAFRIQQHVVGLGENGTARVTSLDAPGSVSSGDPLDVSVILTNDGDMGTAQTVTARLGNDSLAPDGTEAIVAADLAPNDTRTLNAS